MTLVYPVDDVWSLATLSVLCLTLVLNVLSTLLC